MSAADLHTDDLPDRLDDLAEMMRDNGEHREDVDILRAAAAELRRLRQQDAALTRLLDAVGEHRRRTESYILAQPTPEPIALADEDLYAAAAAVEALDTEDEFDPYHTEPWLGAPVARDRRPATCPTCGSGDRDLFSMPCVAHFLTSDDGDPDPWHGGAE